MMNVDVMGRGRKRDSRSLLQILQDRQLSCSGSRTPWTRASSAVSCTVLVIRR